MNKILVSVCMITYGHEEFIVKAIEGMLIQKCSFDIEIIISDDCSPDKTQAIVDDFLNKHPKSGLVNYSRNSFNKGLMGNFISALYKCKGKYIALCEGDDFWIDSLKLQKQVDFMESNSNYSLCFHNADFKFEGTSKKNEPMNQTPYIGNKVFKIDDIIQNTNFHFPTATILFRKDFLQLPDWYKFIQQGDKALQLLLSTKGPFYYMDEIMSVYRKHPTSVGATTRNSITKMRQIQMYSYFNSHTNFEYNDLIQAKCQLFMNGIKQSLLEENIIGLKQLIGHYYLRLVKPLLIRFSLN
ncbi:MAG: glycosyltransferase [Bacteroidota bacterium]|nr:glycosyltransferase [Bacteroidota bacterium]